MCRQIAARPERGCGGWRGPAAARRIATTLEVSNAPSQVEQRGSSPSPSPWGRGRGEGELFSNTINPVEDMGWEEKAVRSVVRSQTMSSKLQEKVSSRPVLG